MHKKLGCPQTSELVELLQGRMVDPELSSLSLHLEECSDCQGKARTLAPHDTLVESLRGAASEADKMVDSVPRLVIERLKQISRSDSSLGGDDRELALGRGSRWDTPEFDFLAPARAADEMGWLGGYRILEVLGRGGMGIVFLAEDPKLGRPVALKVMSPRIAADPTAKDRFLREARAAARLKCDHIVTIYQVDETNGVPHLAMELLEGQSLDDVLRFEQPLGIDSILRIGRDIATGLAAAHEKGQIHRDIKPSNLWIEGKLSAAFRVKIVDFGLARAALDDSQITHSGAIVGTPAFMAPEQARGDKIVDARADLFSLGCVLYRLGTGEVPFKAESTLGTLMAVAMSDPVPPEKLNPSVPPELSRLILQLLEKNPDRRPKSASDVIARIAAIERSLPDRCDRSTTATTSTREIRADATLHSHPALSSSARLRKRRPRLLTLIGLASAISMMLAGIFFWQMPRGGVVRIECNDPSIKVAFNNGELKVTGAYKEPFTVKPGKVDLRIVKKGAQGDDFEFETDKLIVDKRDKVVLRIEVVDGKVQIVQRGKGVLDSKLLPISPEPIAVSDPDRAAANWVLTIGGRLQLNGVDPWIEDLSGLPDERFSVSQVKLVGNSHVTDRGLANLKNLTGLTTLNLDGCNVSDRGLEHFKELRALTELYLHRGYVSDEGLVHLEQLHELRNLGLGGGTNKVTDAGLASLRNLKQLTHLYLDGNKVTDSGLYYLKELKELTELDLSATAVTDSGLKMLEELKKLHSLSLHHTEVTDATLDVVKRIPTLRMLNVSATKVTDEGLENLHPLKNLQMLYLRSTRVTREALRQFHAAVPSCKIDHDGEPL